MSLTQESRGASLFLVFHLIHQSVGSSRVSPWSSFSIDPEILDSLNQPEIQRLHPWDGGKLRLWSKTVPSVSSPIFPVTQEHSWGQHAINALKGSSEAGAASSACCPDTWVFPTDFPKPQADSKMHFSARLVAPWRALSMHCTQQPAARSWWGINPRPDTLLGSILPSSLLIVLTVVTSLCLAATAKSVTKLPSPREGAGNGASIRFQTKMQFWRSPSSLSLQYRAHVCLWCSNQLKWTASSFFSEDGLEQPVSSWNKWKLNYLFPFLHKKLIAHSWMESQK